MIDPSLIDRLVQEIGRRLPAGVDQLRGDIEHNARAVLKETLSRLDLITREEFDVQQQVLQRTRARLEELESQVSELESELKSRN
jgi:BMFP domain-containing protein YqiC